MKKRINNWLNDAAVNNAGFEVSDRYKPRFTAKKLIQYFIADCKNLVCHGR